MNNSTSTNSRNTSRDTDSRPAGFSPWQRLKNKRISYFALPLIIMATVTEIVILATGWKYQQVVCLPNGMGVTFFGIGPIGATILAVELLKLPLAIWAASRSGWQKGFMLFAGLPLICVLTFQLVKDMAVYEMGVAMTPASEMLEKASAEEVKIAHLNGDLAAIEVKKVDRERKLSELAAKKAKAKAEVEESLKRNDESRQDAISLTDYQKKELSEVEARQAAIIKQFDADTEQLTRSVADLRARREKELARATEWNAAEARIENEFKAKMALYTNTKAVYDKAKAEYDNANVFRRQLMSEPVHPGVPPEREVNTVLKPTLVAELEAQIKAKEAELAVVNTKRRDRVAQVSDDARRLREEFDHRSTTKRDQTDRKREELQASLAVMTKEWTAEEKQIDQEYEVAAQKVDAIRAEADASRKRANGFYEAREASIKNTQVHRIATTVEIVRGLIFGQRPVSITATAKERGDLYTDQISMVRVWVYPVLAFIVAFLPTLMVEIGFSTLFHPEKQRPPHRLGFFGRRLHWLYTRAGRLKILRAERMAREAAAAITARDHALATQKTAAAQALSAKEVELQAAREATMASADKHEAELQKQESEWVAKLASTADSLNRALAEKDALRDLQKSEIERQVQLRQNAWSDRVTQLQQDLDEQRVASETERVTLRQEHHKKLQEVSEEGKAQAAQLRSQLADAELAAMDATSKLSHDLKDALQARDAAETQLQHQADSFARQLAQTKDEAARETEKAVRQEKLRAERQQADLEKALRQRDQEFEQRSKQREQELALAFEARLVEEKNRLEQDSRRRVTELEREAEVRAREIENRWKQEVQLREEAAQIRLTQREQQLQAFAEGGVHDAQVQAEQELRRRAGDFERQLEAQARESDNRLRHELQQKELAFQARLKQREQELNARAADHETELQKQLAADLRTRELEWEQQAETRARSAEARLGQDAQQKEEVFQAKLRQREQQLQAQFDVRQTELQAQWEQIARAREQEWQRNAEACARAAESRWIAELQQKEELSQSKLRQRDQQWQVKLDSARAEQQAQVEQELRRREAAAAEATTRALTEQEVQLRKEMQEKQDAALAEAKQREQVLVGHLTAQEEQLQKARKEWETELEAVHGIVEPLKARLAATEKERDEALQTASEGIGQVQEMEQKLVEASSLLTDLKNGRNGKPGNGKKWSDVWSARNNVL